MNEENLCDICIELGEEALSEVCTEYPRFTMEYFCDIEKPYTLIREKCMALSCEEVGRLLFTREEAAKSGNRELPDQDWMEEDREEWESEETRRKPGGSQACRTASTGERLCYPNFTEKKSGFNK